MPRLRPAPDDKQELTAKSSAAPEMLEPEVEIKAEPEIEVEIGEPEPAPEPKLDDATLALRKQVDDLRNASKLREEEWAREREQNLELARQREAQLTNSRKEIYESQVGEATAGLMAAKAEMEKAKLDKRHAIDQGDSAGQADADERMILAGNNLARWQNAQSELEQTKDQPPTQPTQPDPIESWGYPKITTDWLKERRHKLADPKVINRMRFYQDQVTDEGLTPHTRAFLDRMEVLLGERDPDPDPEAPKPPTPKKGPMVSAPVSRDVPNSAGKRVSNGKVTLTPKEVEAAKIAGITVEEYAKQKIRRAQMVASGEYGEQPNE